MPIRTILRGLLRALGLSNPLIHPPALPEGVPDFRHIRPRHFMPALDRALMAARRDIAAIRSDPAPPSFANTIEALERALDGVTRLNGIFSGLRNAVKKEACAPLALAAGRKNRKFFRELLSDAALFGRIGKIPSTGLAPEQRHVLNVYIKHFRDGLSLTPEERRAIEDIDNRLDELGDRFDGNVPSRRQDNDILIPEILRLRHRKAKLLGCDNYADLVARDSMPGSADNIGAFLARVTAGRREEASVTCITNCAPPVFDLDAVQERLFKTAGDIFGVDISQTAGKYPAYHRDVRVFEVKDRETGRLRGIFYADYFARQGKRNHGWAVPLRIRTHNGREEAPLALLSCGFRPETARNGRRLIDFANALTLFHEAGHVLQFLLGEGRQPSVELRPGGSEYLEIFSKALEEIAWRPETLGGLAVDRVHGVPVGDRAWRSYLGSSRNHMDKQRLEFSLAAKADLAAHTLDPEDIPDMEELAERLSGETGATADAVKDGLRTLSHVFGRASYAGQLYSYEWAEAAVATLNRNPPGGNGAAPRLRALFAKSAGDPAAVFREAAGRDVDPEALFKNRRQAGKVIMIPITSSGGLPGEYDI